MTNLSKFQRSVTAAIASIVISTACIAAAVGPATQAGTTPAVNVASLSAQALNA